MADRRLPAVPRPLRAHLRAVGVRDAQATYIYIYIYMYVYIYIYINLYKVYMCA